jgi:hypothetical protein
LSSFDERRAPQARSRKTGRESPSERRAPQARSRKQGASHEDPEMGRIFAPSIQWGAKSGIHLWMSAY